MTNLQRAILERDLRARSQVARGFTLQSDAPVYVQTAFPMPETAHHATNDVPGDCSHVGTGREPQARLFWGGFDTVCSACGATV